MTPEQSDRQLEVGQSMCYKATVLTVLSWILHLSMWHPFITANCINSYFLIFCILDTLAFGGLPDPNPGRDCTSQNQPILRDHQKLNQEHAFHIQANQCRVYTPKVPPCLTLTHQAPVSPARSHPRIRYQAPWDHTYSPKPQELFKQANAKMFTLPHFASLETPVKALATAFSLFLSPAS